MKHLISLLFCFLHLYVSGQNCEKPFLISFTSIARDSVSIKWQDSNGPATYGYQVGYGLRGTSASNTIWSDTLFQKSHTIRDLMPSTQYVVFLRTFCADNKVSGWNGPFSFTTYLTNPTQCGTMLFLQDENCDLGGESFFIDVEQEGILGENIFVESIDLALEHPWLADVEISIENPAGKRSTLTRFNGAAQDDFGILNAKCDSTTRFSSNACLSIRDGSAPFLGTYSPITSLTVLNDGSQAKGRWKINICDRASGDKGILHFLKINLTPELCEPIVDFYISDITGQSARVNWTPTFNCEIIQIEYGEKGFTPGTGTIVSLNCKKGNQVISGLDPLTEYEFFLISNCLVSESAPSCYSSFRTICATAAQPVSFDGETLCESSCSRPCPISGLWQNESDNDVDWIVWQGATNTENTGPENDVNRKGRYVYLESSPEICGAFQKGCLLSSCIAVGANPGCGLGFYLHKTGGDQGVFLVEALLDEGTDTLYTSSGLTDGWEHVTLSLDAYADRFIRLRMTGITTDGSQGDIGLDQIELYGTARYMVQRVYRDIDGDGYGNVDSLATVCETIPAGYTLLSGDCDDGNANIHPGATEIGCNAIDENCNGLDDDNSLPPNIVLVATLNETCPGAANGMLQLSAVGANEPYTFAWSNGDVGDRIENLRAGFYRATVTDASSCAIVTNFYEVKSTSKIDIEILYVDDATCSGRRDGEIKIKPSGGIQPYTYKWSNGQIQATVIGLVEGSYTVTVTDFVGCQRVSDPIKIGVTKPLQIGTTVHRNISCAGKTDGYLEINPINALPPYSIEWDHGPSGSKVDNLGPGIYHAVISDDFECVGDYYAEILEPDTLEQILLSIESIQCDGDRNGKINTKTIGGTAPFKYRWNSGQQTDDISNLPQGDYILEVSDANGCLYVMDTIHLDNPDPLILSMDSIRQATCRLSPDGAIYLSLSGGTMPYAYFWRRTESQGLKAEGLLPGNYGFTGIDRNNCKVSLPGIDIPFGNKSAEVETTLLLPHLCPDALDAAVKADIASGEPPMNYNWNSGIERTSSSYSDTLYNLGHGSYQVTITDAQGCVSTSEVVGIAPITPFSHTLTRFSPNRCNSDSLGFLEVTVFGGNTPYEYLWSTGQNEAFIDNLPNGAYLLTVTDNNTCRYTVDPISMYSQSDIRLQVDVAPTLPNEATGIVRIIPTGGVLPYSIDWEADSLSGFEVSGLSAGWYRATISDHLDCTVDTLIEVTQTTGVADEELDPMLIYPNPASDELVVKTNYTIKNLILIDALGRAFPLKPSGNGQTFSVEDLAVGWYTVRIISSEGRSDHSALLILR